MADYKKFCGEYGIETAALRTCMDKNGHSLTKTCVRALIDAGEVSQAEVDRRKSRRHTRHSLQWAHVRLWHIADVHSTARRMSAFVGKSDISDACSNVCL